MSRALKFCLPMVGEVFVVCVFSLLPLLLLVVLNDLPQRTSDSEIPLLWQAVQGGQLYMYSFSLMGTLAWLVSFDKSNSRLPGRPLFILFIFVPGFVSIVAYIRNPPLDKALPDWLVSLSIYLYVWFALVYLALLLLNNMRAPSIAQTINAEANGLIKSYENKNRG